MEYVVPVKMLKLPTPRRSSTALNALTKWMAHDPRRWCFLVGSGISAPAGLPIGSEFVEAVIESIGLTLKDRRCLKKHAGVSASPEEIHLLVEEQKFLRFEALMACIRRHTEDGLYCTLLNCFAQAKPTRAHFLLASFLDAYSGASVFTTNFDTLIEQARLLEKGGQTWTTSITSKEFKKNEAGLFKLHGTVARWKGRNMIKVSGLGQKEWPAASLYEVGRIRNSAEIKCRFMKSLCSAELVIVSGYSAQDVFDVAAWLRGSRPKALLWLDHAKEIGSERVAPLDGEQVIQCREKGLAMAAVREIAECIERESRDARDRVRFVRANTDAIWEDAIAPVLRFHWAKNPEQRVSTWRKALEAWAVRIQKPEHEIPRKMILSSAYFEAGEVEEARRILEPLPVGVSRNSLLARILLQGGENKPWPHALCLADHLISSRKRKWHRDGLLIKARVLQQRRGGHNQAAALECVRKVLSASSSAAERAEAFFIKARLNRDKAEHRAGAEAAKSAAHEAIKEGDLSREAEAKHELAKLSDRMAKTEEQVKHALQSLDDANNLRKQLMRLKELANGLNVRAIMLQHRYDFMMLVDGRRSKIAKGLLDEADKSLQEAEKHAVFLGKEWETNEIKLNRAWYLIKALRLDDAKAIADDLVSPNPDRSAAEKEFGKRYVLAGACAFLRRDKDAARGFFQKATKSEDVICVAAGVAGLALCNSKMNDRNIELRKAARMFQELLYWRGYLKCERLLRKRSLRLANWEVPDALL